MTAANRDQLTGSYSGVFVPTSPTTITWNLPTTITGGTGRFAGATGSFTFVAASGLQSVNGAFTGQYTETFEGTINLSSPSDAFEFRNLKR